MFTCLRSIDVHTIKLAMIIGPANMLYKRAHLSVSKITSHWQPPFKFLSPVRVFDNSFQFLVLEMPDDTEFDFAGDLETIADNHSNPTRRNQYSNCRELQYFICDST